MHRKHSLLDLLAGRRSTPSLQLSGPGPTDAELDAMLREAVRVPDHGKLAPWRVIAIRDADVARFGEWTAAHHAAVDPTLPDAAREKDRLRYAHASCVLVVVASVTPGHKVPECEQLLSAGCVAFSLLLAAHGLGFAAQWLTGWAAYDAAVHDQLGLAPNENIVGFIHIGRSTVEPPERVRPDPAAKLTHWSPA